MKENSVFLIEPFYGGSHKHWVDNLIKHSSTPVKLFSLKSVHWKWRMASAAITLASMVNADKITPVSFLVTDMLDVGLFKSLLNSRLNDVPIVVYFHENQLTYPWNESENKHRERHYAWLNFTSILVADRVVFSSDYHMEAVFKALPEFLHAFPDNLAPQHIPSIRRKSMVISPGINSEELGTPSSTKGSKTRILWNHRWEHDKNPELFFETLFRLKQLELPYELVVCGESFPKSPSIFREAKSKLSNEIVHWGYFSNRTAYIEAIKKCHVLPVTANQEFFGLSVMEAAFCGVKPLLPKRLSYPSLYAGNDLFYDDEADLLLRLIHELKQPTKFELGNEFDKYRWEKLISEYDALWLSL